MMYSYTTNITLLMCVCISSLSHCLGDHHLITGSSTYAIKRHSYKFTCKSGDVSGNIDFMRGSKLICGIIMADGKCAASSTDHRIQCGCLNDNLFYANITDVSIEDDNTWHCRNAFGASLLFYLPVYVPPTIVRLSSTAVGNIVNEGSDVTFTCTVDGRPLPEITWGTSTMPNIAKGNTMTLYPVRCTDSNTYSCIATNIVGKSVISYIPLTVQCKPTDVTGGGIRIGIGIGTGAAVLVVVGLLILYWRKKVKSTKINDTNMKNMAYTPEDENIQNKDNLNFKKMNMDDTEDENKQNTDNLKQMNLDDTESENEHNTDKINRPD